MKHLIYILLIPLFILSAVQTAAAGDISISSTVDKNRLSVNDTVTLQVVISGAGGRVPDPVLPELDDFTSYSAGRSQNISFVNGQMSSYIVFNYDLVPNSAGTKTIGPVKLEYNGKIYSTHPITIEVTVSSAAAVNQPGTQQFSSSSQEQNAAPGQSGHKEIFIESYADNLTPYINEQVTLTFAFYQSVQLFDNPVYTPPVTTGFWSEDMPPQKKYYKMIDGRKYLVTEIKTALFPTTAGEHTIGPAKVEATVDMVEDFMNKRRNRFSIFDDNPFSIFRRGKPILLTTEPITIEVKPIPESGRPEGFNGAVGDYTVSLKADTLEVKQGEPVTLDISIGGNGNIKTLSEPLLEFPDSFKVYDSGSSEEITKEDYRVGGMKKFEKVIMPTKPGEFIVDGISFSFFHPGQGRYKTVCTGPLAIKVNKAAEQPQRQDISFPAAGVEKRQIKLLGKDILHIKTQLAQLKRRRIPVYENGLFTAFPFLCAVIIVLSFFDSAHRRKISSDIRYARLRRAHKMAKGRLKNATAGMKSGKSTEEVCREVYRAFSEYIADKLNVAAASLTYSEVDALLKENQASEKLITSINELLQECDKVRFASVSYDKHKLAQIINTAEDLMVELTKIRF